ncbi:transposase [Streptomyces sp. NPDC056632]|uniref:IS110 family transposase n=1 Tax=Streptomyces sp. NPDC056632 TaxID=3345884 RepID=UPI003694A6A7
MPGARWDVGPVGQSGAGAQCDPGPGRSPHLPGRHPRGDGATSTGSRTSFCWSHVVWSAGWSTPMMSRTSRAGQTDRLDAVRPAKHTERGMLRPSFVPPKPVRELRDLTKARAVMAHERTRHKQRTEKLLEDARSSCPP